MLNSTQSCDACKSRSLQSAWPTSNPSASWNVQGACTRCASQKTRCATAGESSPEFSFSSSWLKKVSGELVHPTRGKAAGTRQSITLGRVDTELTQLFIQLNDRIMDLQKNQVANEEDRRQLVIRVAILELQIARLKKVKS